MKDKQLNITEEFVARSLYHISESTRMIGICLDQLSEEDIWKKPSNQSNSVGNLILHLCGNITQYIISSLGETKDVRERDKEFSTLAGYRKEELWVKLLDVVDKAKITIANTSLEQLLTTRGVQGSQFSGIGIVLHVVEHYSYHTGQIALWTKILKNEDLGFYSGRDLNRKNEE